MSCSVEPLTLAAVGPHVFFMAAERVHHVMVEQKIQLLPAAPFVHPFPTTITENVDDLDDAFRREFRLRVNDQCCE